MPEGLLLYACTIADIIQEYLFKFKQNVYFIYKTPTVSLQIPRCPLKMPTCSFKEGLRVQEMPMFSKQCLFVL